MMPEKQDFYHTVLSKNRAAAQQQNSSYIPTTIPPARIAENANFSDIFPFKFKANELPPMNKKQLLLFEGKTICLILDIIVTADGMKKTLVREIDKFLFTLDGITILVKVLIMDAPQVNNLLPRTTRPILAFEFELEEEKPIIETFMALGLTSNWAEETEQEHFTPHSEPETPGWNIPYSKPEP
ncbi:hypothetical protein G9A89_003342 [Geosiphon pyriformis]|nr:hypothetical protein G9A89_003342 [Geosiphon pyriformis]